MKRWISGFLIGLVLGLAGIAGAQIQLFPATVTQVLGTANRVTVNPPTGIPVVDIAATYVGQASITTLGIIGTGTWQAGVIAGLYGGTGLSTAAVGDLIYASAVTPTWSRLADVAAGSYLRSGGVGVAPLWSTLILPNSATVNQIVYATGANTWGGSANLTYNGTSFAVGTAGPHAIGGATDSRMQLLMTGTFTPGAGNAFGVSMRQTINGNVAGNAYGLEVGPAIVEAGSGVHSELFSAYIYGNFTNGVATATDVGSLQIGSFAAPTGALNASSLKILDAPTGATNNYSLWIDSGLPRIDSTTGAGAGAGTITNTPNAGGGNPAIYILINVNGTSYAVPAWAL